MTNLEKRQKGCDWCQNTLTTHDMVNHESLCEKCRDWIENNSGKDADETVGKPMTKQVCENYLECGGYANVYRGDALHCDKCNSETKVEKVETVIRQKADKNFINGLKLALNVK